MQLLLDMDKSDMENCKKKIKETHMDDNYYNNKRQKKTGANFEKKKRKNRTCTRPHYKKMGSISVSGQLPTDPSSNPTVTLTFCQLTVVELGEG